MDLPSRCSRSGGNAGSAISPLLAAFVVVVPWGQEIIACFSIAAVAGMIVLYAVGRWYGAYLAARKAGRFAAGHTRPPGRPLTGAGHLGHRDSFACSRSISIWRVSAAITPST